MYYCTECKKKHRCGKIYQDHLQFKKVEKKEYPSDKIMKFNIDSLRPIAQRQITKYLEKIKLTPKMRGVYISKINELIEFEKNS